jgi:hypothetical protein
VERPRRKVRFARLMHRRVRALGRPLAGAACGGNLSLTRLAPNLLLYKPYLTLEGTRVSRSTPPTNLAVRKPRS